MNKFKWSVRTYYDDADVSGVVFHSNHIKFLEHARTEWLRFLGFELDKLREQDNFVFAVRQLQIDYFQPAFFNDELQVITQITQLGRTNMTMHQEKRRTKLTSAS